jgi:hypothetical protein
MAEAPVPAATSTLAKRPWARLHLHPYFDQIDARLRVGQSPHQVHRWIDASLPPEVPRPGVVTLWRHQQKIGPAKIQTMKDIVLKQLVPFAVVDTIEKEAESLIVQEQMLVELLTAWMEQLPPQENMGAEQYKALRKEFLADKRRLRAEIRETMAPYQAMLKQHRESLQSVGLLIRVSATTKLEHSGEVQQNATGTVVHRGVYAFLTPDEAARLQQLEAKIQAGEIDVTQMYKDVAPLFRLEQLANRR